uniref:Uncharacterized protein n=1 Tax=Lepeophtheirus salmonis TaxID=72036 RepID=A0A0K2V6M8_LEPSM
MNSSSYIALLLCRAAVHLNNPYFKNQCASVWMDNSIPIPQNLKNPLRSNLMYGERDKTLVCLSGSLAL